MIPITDFTDILIRICECEASTSISIFASASASVRIAKLSEKKIIRCRRRVDVQGARKKHGQRLPRSVRLALLRRCRTGLSEAIPRLH